MRVIHDALPDTVVNFISIKPSPERRQWMDAIREANRLIEAWTQSDSRLKYTDVHHAMLNLEGEPRRELWTSDGVHLSRAGYRLWAEIIRPRLI